MGAKKSNQLVLQKSSHSDNNHTTPPQTTFPESFSTQSKNQNSLLQKSNPKIQKSKKRPTRSIDRYRVPEAANCTQQPFRPRAEDQPSAPPPMPHKMAVFLMATPSVSPRLEALRSSWTAFRRKGMGRITEFPTRIGISQAGFEPVTSAGTCGLLRGSLTAAPKAQKSPDLGAHF